MKVIHGNWTPDNTQDFVQEGQFSIWIESNEVTPRTNKNIHPQHLKESDCLEFLKQAFALIPKSKDAGGFRTIKLPTHQGKPLASPELKFTELDEKSVITLDDWQVYSFNLVHPLEEIKNIHFLSYYQDNLRLGNDFLFWLYFSQAIKAVLYKDNYIPALLARKLGKETQLYRYWKLFRRSLNRLSSKPQHKCRLLAAQVINQNHYCNTLLKFA